MTVTAATRTAIVGIGQTEFSKESGRTELRLAVEAIAMALRDGGIAASEVDGLTTFSYDTNPEIAIGRALGMGDLTFFSRVPYGGGAACGVLAHAAMAVATGAARTVVAYRALNMRSGTRAGARAGAVAVQVNAEEVARSWYAPFGLRTPASYAALFATRYLHEFGATSADLGMISVAARQHAATNPNAWFHGKPITLDDHQNSRFIVEPLRMLDCCQESDGAVAVVVTSADRARHTPHPPAWIRSAAQGTAADQHEMTSFYRAASAELPEMAVVARQLYATAGIGPQDIDVAMLYDHFTPYVLPQLEEFGFCERGGAAAFVRAGELQLGGALPMNTHGGQLGEGYLHGMNGITEAVRQIRGTAANLVPGVANVLVTGGGGVPTSGAVIGVEP